MNEATRKIGKHLGGKRETQSFNISGFRGWGWGGDALHINKCFWLRGLKLVSFSLVLKEKGQLLIIQD